MKTFIQLFIILITTFSLRAQIIPISSSQKVKNTNLIIEGEITNQQSFETAKTIYTDYSINVKNIIKGAINTETITLRSIGGIVGDKMLKTQPSNNLNTGDYALYFLKKDPNQPYYEVAYFGQSKIILNKPLTTIQVKELQQGNVGVLTTSNIKSVTSTITSINPTNANAGTGETVTITGSGFGATGPTSSMKVWTSYSNNPNSFISHANAYNYVSWSDTQIVFRLRTQVGTGKIRVGSGASYSESTQTLQVNYNVKDNPTPLNGNIYPVNLPALQGQGITFIPNVNFTNTDAINRTKEAMEQWTCESDIDWQLDIASSTTNTNNTTDGLSVIYFESMGSSTLGVTLTTLGACSGNGRWYVSDVDLKINSNTNFNFSLNPSTASQIDFYSVVLHELGHVRNLGHVLDPTDVMYPSIPTGVDKRVLHQNDIDGGLWVQNDSNSNSVCSKPLMVDGTCTVLAQTTAIPDPNFENYLETHDANGNVVAISDPTNMGNGIAGDQLVFISRINIVLELFVPLLSISNLTGIQDFSALTKLICPNNPLGTLDVSQNLNLSILNCRNNSLSSLNVSSNINLTYLSCSNNQLTSLNVNNNLMLITLYANYNQLVSLNVSTNTSLTLFQSHNNQLNTLNVKNGNNTNITSFITTNNPNLTCIEVDNAAYSTANWTNIDPASSFSLHCPLGETYVPDLNFEAYLEANGMGNGIANDDYVTTANINTVINLNVSNLNIADLTGIEDFVALTTLDCKNNSLTSLDLSQNTFLEFLQCYTNQITSLDLTNNINLKTLWCGYNNLTTINTSNLNLLEDFRVNNNSITSFDTSNNPNLIRFYSSYNPISTLNISQNINLVHLDCQSNLLNTLDISLNNLLEIIACGYNNLTSLNVSNNPQLTYIECRNNNLTSINLNNNLALERLVAWSNNITNLDVHLNTNLYQLYVENNDLHNLNFKNGNNLNTTDFYFRTNGNSNLTCIEVDDPVYSTANWTQIDATSSFSLHCPLGETYVPDNNFETYLETHNASGVIVAVGDPTSMGNGIANDDYVTTANINSVNNLYVPNLNISDLTGIEDFTALDYFDCNNNTITNVDFSQNSQILQIDISDNLLTTLDLSNNLDLEELLCFSNAITSLDLSLNSNLEFLECYGNNLTLLNVKNGNNVNFTGFDAGINPNLTCIEVDNPTYSNANWTNIDPASSFSNNCPNLCSYPSNQTASNFTTIGATLDWQENGTATTWDLEIGIQGFTPTGNPTDNDVNKPYVWSNGQANASYDYYVRADCNADNINTSSWTGPFSFSTLSKTVCENGFELVNGTPFTDISQGSIAFADIDSDNDQDVLISGIDSSNQIVTELYVNDGLGNFTLVVGTPFTAVYDGSITFADIDNDNDQDVLITGIFSTTTYQPITKLYANDGLGNFTLVNATPFEDVRFSSAAFIDIDNDNDLDVLISGQNQANQRISKVYTNNGSGVFTFNTNLNGLSHSYIIIGDIDNDNDNDIFITGTNGGQTQNYLYKNDGLGNFTASPTSIMPVFNGKAIFADIDNDNDLDLFVSGSNVIYSNTINFYLNDGLGNYTLTPTAPFNGFNAFNGGIYAAAFEILDIDNDNDMDVALINNNSKQLYENDGLGNYTLLVETPFINTTSGSSMISFDMDNDNDQDILITGLTPASTPTSNLYKNNINYDTKYTATGWTNGTPTLNKCAVIDQDYTTTSFSAYKTTVNTNKALTIAANTYMQVQKSIENNGTITIEPTGSIVQIDDTATVTGTGVFNTKIATTPLQDASRFTYFSSPSANETLNTFASWGDLNYLWEFNETTQDWDYLSNSATAMQAGNGYIVRGHASNTYPNYVGLTTFQNGYNNGVITQNLHFKGDASTTANLDNDSNLVGNPYPSAINGTKLLNATLNPTAGTLYFWTHNSPLVNGDFSTDDYAMWNLSGGTVAISGGIMPTGYIASGQGFFIEAEGNETLPLGQEVISTLTFNNEMRETLNNTDFRTPNNTEFDKIWLNLSNNQGVFNQTLLSFLPNTTINHDIAYDGKRSANGVATFYSMGQENQHYGIQALPLLQDETVIKLGYQIENEDITNLEISIDYIENLQDVTVYLRDNLLHTVHNLSLESYQFSVSETGIFNTRFELLFRNSALGGVDNVLSENLIVSNQNDDSILVKTVNGSIIKNIKIYDVLGKLILKSNPNNTSINLPATNINQGTVLFLKVTLENGQILNRKFIKL